MPGLDPDAQPADVGSVGDAAVVCGYCRLISSPGASTSVDARSS